MKHLACRDVIPGCDASFLAASDDGILLAVARHARLDHGVTEVPDDLVVSARRAIRVVALG